jgi:hypothetical protein
VRLRHVVQLDLIATLVGQSFAGRAEQNAPIVLPRTADIELQFEVTVEFFRREVSQSIAAQNVA